MINAAIIGATGYAGEELMRLLSAHPEVNVKIAVSKSFSGKKLSDVYGNWDDTYILEDLDIDKIAAECEVAFCALPHGASMETCAKLIDAGLKVIDFSGDLRYDDPAVYEKWYKLPHTQIELNKKAVYGLPEYYKDKIAATNIVANPGCYTTTSILALYPLLKNGLISPVDIVVDAKSGVSGAGRNEKLAFSFCETHESFKAYGVATHRHTSEIEQELSKAAGQEVALCFTPHLLPVKRGILATCYTKLNGNITEEQIAVAYNDAYGNAPFVKVLPHGSLPELKFVTGSNNCFIGYKMDERLSRLIVVSCTDNLIKGAAGQAVQNMNIMLGFDETLGLPKTAMYL